MHTKHTNRERDRERDKHADRPEIDTTKQKKASFSQTTYRIYSHISRGFWTIFKLEKGRDGKLRSTKWNKF